MFLKEPQGLELSGDQNVDDHKSFPISESTKKEDRLYDQTIVQASPSSALKSNSHDFQIEFVENRNDTEELDKPLALGMPTKDFGAGSTHELKLKYSLSYFNELLRIPTLQRNFVLIGSLKHGKSSLMERLISELCIEAPYAKGEPKYTDLSPLEQARKMTMRLWISSWLVQDSRGKSFVFNIADSPGHCDFLDETACGLRISEGVVLVVDAVEGILPQMDSLIEQAILQKKSLILLISKIDKLFLDLSLRPDDVYAKLRHTISEVNRIVKKFGGQNICPLSGKVLFTSAKYNICFNLKSLAAWYKPNAANNNNNNFHHLFWKDAHTRQNQNNLPLDGKHPFTAFALEPIFKIFSSVASDSCLELTCVLSELGLNLDLQRSCGSHDRLNAIFRNLFGGWSVLVDSVVTNISDPASDMGWRNVYGEEVVKSDMSIANVVKLIPKIGSKNKMLGLARVFYGEIFEGQNLELLEPHTLTKSKTLIEKIWLLNPNQTRQIDKASVGNWVWIQTESPKRNKSFTIGKNISSAFLAINYISKPIFRLGVEPFDPSEMPELLERIEVAISTHGVLCASVEPSGEHILSGSGELYLDCILGELRTMHTALEVKVSDPLVQFRETCSSSSGIACPTSSPNKANKITMLAKPLEKIIVDNFQSLRENREAMYDIFGQVGWNELEIDSVWSFGLSGECGNILIDETSIFENGTMDTLRPFFIQGFDWCARAGPLCEEPVDQVSFRIMEALVGENDEISAGQIIPTVKRASSAALMTAKPRILEPVCKCMIIGPVAIGTGVYKILNQRRGTVISDTPIPGTPLYVIEGLVPALDAFGLDVAIKLETKGQVSVTLNFDHWQIAPGDPLDTSIHIPKLSVANPVELSRDIVIKTRRRKGLSREPDLATFVDADVATLLGL